MTQITAQEAVRDTLDKQHSDVEERLKIAKSETEEVSTKEFTAESLMGTVSLRVKSCASTKVRMKMGFGPKRIGD